MLYLATHAEERVSTREVAEFYGISLDHVAKVVPQLASHGFVRAERGRTGGISLGRPPEQITVGDVVELFEGPVALLECVRAENVCVIQPHCRLRTVLTNAGARLIQDLKAVTLADLTARPTTVRELLQL